MFAFGLLLIEFATKPDIQKLYDRKLGTFRRDKLETLVDSFVRQLSEENTLRMLIYRMLDFNSEERISFSELRSVLPDKAALMSYLLHEEGRIDARVFADGTASPKLDPKQTHRLMAYNTMQANPRWKKGDEDDQDVSAAIDMHDRNSSHFHTILSRRSMESGDFEAKTRQKKVVTTNYELPEAAKKNRPLKSKYMGKHDLAAAQDQLSGPPVYTDFLKSNHSVNRVFRSRDLPPGAYVDQNGNVVSPQSTDVTFQRETQKQNLNKVVEENFIQADIRRGLETDFEKYLQAKQKEEDVHKEEKEHVERIANIQPQPKMTKYYQEYLNYPANYRPEFKQVQVDPRTGHSIVLPLDPYDAMVMDRYSNVTATYGLGPNPQPHLLEYIRSKAR